MKKVIVLLMFVLGLSSLYANNIQVANVSIQGNFVVFDLSWENSWNDATNHDAAWVFVKFRTPNDNWQHVILDSLGHTPPTDCTIDPVSGGIGVFVYRSTVATGNVNFQQMKLSWNIGENGVSSTSELQVKVMAIEMVYVPEGVFYLGSGYGGYGEFRHVSYANPVGISASPVIVRCNGTSYDDSYLEGGGILVDGDEGIDVNGTSAVDNPDYPTGYKAFYCMKYEISQGQWADFLNTLDAVGDDVNYYTGNGYRYSITGNWPNRISSKPYVACNYISWMDGCAYADWSGLRPMTELEFEKVCRGTVYPVVNEYAWGTNLICSSTYSITGSGTDTEAISNFCSGNGYGNALYNTTDGSIGGPLRCGVFAYSASNKTRAETGGTIYGIMEMSGNLSERCVTLGKTAGRNFKGNHGDGVLSIDGRANEYRWPGMIGSSVTGAEGSGLRGGYWSTSNHTSQVSYRNSASYTIVDRTQYHGFRCVRSAPAN